MRKQWAILAIYLFVVSSQQIFVFSARHVPYVKYSNEPSLIVGISGFEDRFVFGLNRIFEYIDSNMNGHFDEEERVLGVITLRQFSWKRFERNTDGSKVVVFEGARSYGMWGRHRIKINVTIVISNDITSIIRIENWNWKRNNSKLCVEYLVAGHHRQMSRKANHGYEVSFYGSDTRLTLDLNETGIADNETIEVTGHSNGSSFEINIPHFSSFAQVGFLLNISSLKENLEISYEQEEFSFIFLSGLIGIIAVVLAFRIYKLRGIKRILDAI